MKRCLTCSTVHAGETWLCPSCGASPGSTGGIPEFAPELAHENDGFPPEAYARLASLEAANFWFRARNRLILWALSRHFPRLLRYLEIGCGTGYVLAGVEQTYPEAALTGSDLFASGLGFAASRVKRAELLQMDSRRIPYTEEFDVIGAFDVLEHIEEDEAVLEQMKRALRPGGGIILTVPQHPWLWSVQDDYACHVRRYRVGELLDKVQRAGFRVEYETSFVSLLLPAMLASRMGRRRSAKTNDPLAELRLAAPINGIFDAAMRIEHGFIRLGLRFPIGGSRLLIARKG